MRSVGIGQVAGSVDLVWPHLAQKIDYNLNVVFTERTFLDQAGFVERHVEKVQPLGRHAAATGRRASFTAADHPFDQLHFVTVNSSRLLVPKELVNVTV
jgi:hypothetical protein